MASYGAQPPTAGGFPTSVGPPGFTLAGPFSKLPECAIAPTFGLFAGFAQDKCGQDLACVCRKSGFVFLAAVQGAIAKTCSFSNQTDALALLRHTCGDLVPSLNDSRSHQVIVSFTIVLSLVWMAVALRFIARKVASTRIGLDDWLILLALVFHTALAFSQVYAVRFGMGNHVVVVSPRQLRDFGKLSFVGQIMFALSITFAKLSLLALYNRIFRNGRFRIIGNLAGVIITLWCIATLLVTIFNCHPIRFFWDKSIQGGHCLNRSAQTYSLSIISILTDVFVWVVPIPWLWRLILDWPKKIGLIATFALGGFVCIAGVIRVVFVERLVFTDITWSVVDLDLWINIEGGIGIVCTCLPILRSLFRVLLPSSFLSYFSRNSRSDGPHELKDQFNIRGRLRRIPSATAKEDELSNPETGLGSNWRPEQWSSSKTLNDSKPDIGISVEGITRVPAKGSSNVI